MTPLSTQWPTSDGKIGGGGSGGKTEPDFKKPGNEDAYPTPPTLDPTGV